MSEAREATIEIRGNDFDLVIVAPPVPGLAEAGFLDDVGAMALKCLPDSLIVIGAGFVAVELAQMFARLGVAVTILARQNRVLTREDPEIGLGLTKYLRDEGIDLRTQAAVERVDRADRYRIRVSRSGQTEVLEADELAARRRATGFLLATDEI